MPKYLTFYIDYGEYILLNKQSSKAGSSSKNISEWTTKLIPEYFDANSVFSQSIGEHDGKSCSKTLVSLIGEMPKSTKVINATLVSIIGMTAEHLLAPNNEDNGRSTHYVTYTKRNSKNWYLFDNNSHEKIGDYDNLVSHLIGKSILPYALMYRITSPPDTKEKLGNLATCDAYKSSVCDIIMEATQEESKADDRVSRFKHYYPKNKLFKKSGFDESTLTN